MSTPATASTSIIGFAGTPSSDVAILLNRYHAPFDAESVLSEVHSVELTSPSFSGTAVGHVEEWLTGFDASGNGFVACSMEGRVHFLGPAPGMVQLASEEPLNAIVAVGDEEAFAVGLSGSVVRADRQGVAVVMPGLGIRLNAIDATGRATVYAVGDRGLIVHFDGRDWRTVKPFSTVNLLAVICLAVDDVYVAGAQGSVFHWDGSAWNPIEASSVTFTSLAHFRGELYLAAGKDGIHQLIERKVEKIKPPTIYRMKAVGSHLFAAGNDFFAWFDSKGWCGGPYVVA